MQTEGNCWKICIIQMDLLHVFDKRLQVVSLFLQSPKVREVSERKYLKEVPEKKQRRAYKMR